MALEQALSYVDRQNWMDTVGTKIQEGVAGTFEATQPVGQKIKNFLHGTWLGHPLHPVLTDIPVGSWTVALVLDGLELTTGRKEFARAAETAIKVGLVGAIGSAVTGITDWEHTDGRARRIGLTHGLLNLTSTLLYTSSIIARRKKSKRLGQGLSLAGFLISGAAAYLGGHLVYAEQIGVNHTIGQTLSDEFRAVLAETELAEGEMRHVEVDKTQVLLVRREGQIFALAEVCSHLGGPLADGDLNGTSVRCPWHGSRFSIVDGRVLDGPATHPQPCFETRISNGQIEVRAGQNCA